MILQGIRVYERELVPEAVQVVCDLFCSKEESIIGSHLCNNAARFLSKQGDDLLKHVFNGGTGK